MAEAQPVPGDPLTGLIDIPSPHAVSLWPQTWTSRIAVAVVMATMVVATWWFVHRWWVNRYRREALAELDRIEGSLAGGQPTEGVAADVALLVRRTALAAFPRGRVAALAGAPWLTFLDRSYGGIEFSQGAGRLLASGPYDSAQPDRSQLRPLLDLVRRWIKVHHD